MMLVYCERKLQPGAELPAIEQCLQTLVRTTTAPVSLSTVRGNTLLDAKGLAIARATARCGAARGRCTHRVRIRIGRGELGELSVWRAPDRQMLLLSLRLPVQPPGPKLPTWYDAIAEWVTVGEIDIGGVLNDDEVTVICRAGDAPQRMAEESAIHTEMRGSLAEARGKWSAVRSLFSLPTMAVRKTQAAIAQPAQPAAHAGSPVTAAGLPSYLRDPAPPPRSCCSPSEETIAPLPGASDRAALPFAGRLTQAEEAALVRPVEGRPARSEADPDETLPIAPPQHQARTGTFTDDMGAPVPPLLSVEEYAQFCAARSVIGSETPELLRRFGIASPADSAALRERFSAYFRNEPDALSRFALRVQQIVTGLRADR